MVPGRRRYHPKRWPHPSQDNNKLLKKTIEEHVKRARKQITVLVIEKAKGRILGHQLVSQVADQG